MESIRQRMNPFEHCSECGALLVPVSGGSLCPHCGAERENWEEGISLIRLSAFVSEGVRFHLSDDRQAA